LGEKKTPCKTEFYQRKSPKKKKKMFCRREGHDSLSGVSSTSKNCTPSYPRRMYMISGRVSMMRDTLVAIV
jgi:hypothetical protein